MGMHSFLNNGPMQIAHVALGLKDQLELSDRPGNDATSALFERSINMTLSIPQCEEMVPRKESLDLQSGQLRQISPIALHTGTGKVDEAKETTVKQDIPHEEAPPSI
jgi:hypothetical protein